MQSRSEAATEAAAAESAMTGYLWFPEEAELSLLHAALQLLRPLTPLPFSKSPLKLVAQGSPQSAGGRLACHAWTLQQLHWFMRARVWCAALRLSVSTRCAGGQCCTWMPWMVKCDVPLEVRLRQVMKVCAFVS